MIQCSECEFFHRGPGGQVAFRCDPFSTIKEPECLAKWQLLRSTELSQKVERMVTAYEATLELYKRMAPLQEKMFRHMEQEIDDIEEAESWKYGQGDDDDDDDEDDDERDNDWGDGFGVDSDDEEDDDRPRGGDDAPPGPYTPR